MTAGDIYTIAGTGTEGFAGDGGPATAAKLALPFGVAVDGAGNVVIADFATTGCGSSRPSTGTFYGMAMTAGDIYTIAGTGPRGSPVTAGPQPPPSSPPREVRRWTVRATSSLPTSATTGSGLSRPAPGRSMGRR